MLEWREKVPLIEYSPFDDLYEKLAAINGIVDIRKFLNPTHEDLHDPFELENIEVARDVIIRAIGEKVKIAVSADCDCDGVNSAAIMYMYLKKFTDNVVYIHGQREHGHGIHTMMDEIPKDTSLLIIVDSSSSEWKECLELKKRGIKTIIIDHHPIEDENRHCILVNPQNDSYPNKELSGSGLVWKVCQVLDDYYRTDYADEFIDLAAVGLSADMMDMKAMENRYIIHRGLSNIRNNGLMAILKVKGKNPKYLSSTNIGYDIAPFINAAARMNKIELALELLTCDDYDQCLKLAKDIEKLNKERKGKQSDFADDIIKEVNDSHNIIIVVNGNVGKSFAGLVANELAQKYQRPCLILAQDDGDGKLYNGSYRSYGGFDLKSYFSSLSTVESTGGHPEAGGVSIKVENFDAFIQEAVYGLRDANFEQVIEYDLEIDVDEITEDFIKKVCYFYRISGKNFNEAKFLVRGLSVFNKEMLGKETKETLKIDCGDVQLLKFKVNEEYEQSIPDDGAIDVIGTLNLNTFPKRIKGTKNYEVIKTNQIFVTDFKVS